MQRSRSSTADCERPFNCRLPHLSSITPLPLATSTRCDAVVPQTSTAFKLTLVRVKLASSQVAPPSLVRQMLQGEAVCLGSQLSDAHSYLVGC